MNLEGSRRSFGRDGYQNGYLFICRYPLNPQITWYPFWSHKSTIQS